MFYGMFKWIISNCFFYKTGLDMFYNFYSVNMFRFWFESLKSKLGLCVLLKQLLNLNKTLQFLMLSCFLSFYEKTNLRYRYCLFAFYSHLSSYIRTHILYIESRVKEYMDKQLKYAFKNIRSIRSAFDKKSTDIPSSIQYTVITNQYALYT